MSEKHKSQRSDTVLTPAIRWAYPFVHKKRDKRANGTPMKTSRYDMVGLFPKLNADPSLCANYKFLSDLCMVAVARVTEWGCQWPQGGHWPIQDGDAPPKPKPGQTPKDYPWRKGHWIIEVTNYLDPGPRVAILQNGQPLEIPAQTVGGRTLYKGGDFGIASIAAYTYHNETYGVNFGFEGILWTAEGEVIGHSGPRSAASMFAQVSGMSAPAAGVAIQRTDVYVPPGGPAYVAQAPAPMPGSAPVYVPPVPPPAPVYVPPAPLPSTSPLPPFPGR